MKQDMILILDLGSEENPRLAREIRGQGQEAGVGELGRRAGGG